MPLKVCIIGGGPSGLAALRAFQSVDTEIAEVICLEKQSNYGGKSVALLVKNFFGGVRFDDVKGSEILIYISYISPRSLEFQHGDGVRF